MANIAPLVNTRGPLFVYPKGIVKRTHFHAMAMYANELQKRVAKADLKADALTHNGKSVPVVDAVATVDDSGRNWSIALVNRSPDEDAVCTVRMKNILLEGQFPARVLAGDSPDAFNDIEHPYRVAPQNTEMLFSKGAVTLPPHSLSIIKVFSSGSASKTTPAPQDINPLVKTTGNPADLVIDTCPPGAATGKRSEDRFILANDLIAVTWRCMGQHLSLAEVRDPAAGQCIPQSGNLFAVEVDKSLIPASDFTLVEGPVLAALPRDPTSVRAAGRLGGWQISATFRHQKSGVTVRWRAELRDGSHYVRQILSVSGSAGTLTGVQALGADIGPASVVGTAVAGNPVASAHWFAGLEMPMSRNLTHDGGAVTCELPCSLPLAANQTYEIQVVIGSYPAGQLRRAFLRYLERERARPYQPFLHYNGWFDFVFNPREQPMIETIQAYQRQLITKRSIPMDAFVLDDGWDESNLEAGFWTVDAAKFPHQFAPLATAAAATNSHFGIWISPLGGYSQSHNRTAQAARLGLTASPQAKLDLSFPPYYAWFRDRCASLMKEDDVTYFKFDNAGNGVNPHFMALLRLCNELRRISPRLFINITVGTWPSPFFINNIDSTWRGGGDIAFEGPGNKREQWITYRDAQTWRGVVSKAPLYPLNSLMIHGIILANALNIVRDRTDLRNEARSYVASGTQLQELYINPSMTPPETWDQLAEALRWGRANADVLVDTHWVGGDPSKGANVYGWAAWSTRKGILTLRNPSAGEMSYTVDIGKALELPRGAASHYTVTGAFPDTPSPIAEAEAGKPVTFTLKPFEVLVLELVP
jgi:hypothetical protein